MRVLLVTKPLVPPWNDSAKLVPRDLARAASGRHELHVLVTPEGGAEWPARVRAHPLYRGAGDYRPGPLQQLRLLAAVWRLRGAVDALHFFFQPHPAASRVARALARACRRPTIHTVLSAPRAGADPARLLFADRTVTLSLHTARALGMDMDAAMVIPPGLAEDAPVGAARAAAACRAAGVEPPFMLYPGDYEFSGGHALLLDIWNRSPELPMLVLAGRAKTPRAEAHRRIVEARALSLGLEPRLRALGTVPDLPALVAACEAVLFPAESLYGKTDLPLVILEAWRESRPVLTSNLPPLAEAVAGAGAVLPAAADAWQSALRSLPERGRAWGEAGRRRFLERHTALGVARAYEAIYDGIEAGSRQRDREER